MHSTYLHATRHPQAPALQAPTGEVDEFVEHEWHYMDMKGRKRKGKLVNVQVEYCCTKEGV